MTQCSNIFVWLGNYLMTCFVSTEFVYKSEISAICNKLHPDTIEQFWLTKLVRGKLVNAYWDTNIGKEDLYKDYQKFCRVRDLEVKSFLEFDYLIFGNLLLAHSTTEDDYRPNNGKRNIEKQAHDRLAHCVPELERCRRLYLEARPDLVSHVTQLRFTPRFIKRKIFLRFDVLLLLSGIIILAYQALMLTLQGTWTSFSLFHFMEMAEWKTGLAWLTDTSTLSTTKLLSQKLLSYAEIALILLTLGLLIYINTDYE